MEGKKNHLEPLGISFFFKTNGKDLWGQIGKRGRTCQGHGKI